MNSTRRTVRGAIVVAVLAVTVPKDARAQASDNADVVIRAGTLIDGRGRRMTNAAVVIRDGRIVQVLQGQAATRARPRATIYDLGAATLLPGLIDGHVHATQYINASGRLHTQNDSDTPAQATLAVALNLRRMLESGVTTAQSMGSTDDADFRDAIRAGAILGPRLITTLNPITNESLTPDSLRALVRQRKAAGADAIKIFASRSIREGGTTTMSADQLGALCGEARSLGLRTLVHAHSEESIRLAVMAGCTQVEHGIFVTQDVLNLMAQRGTYFDPQCGLIFQNYLDNRAAYEGIGNFNNEGFESMKRAMPMAERVIGMASRTPSLKLVWGTDAVAGAHGREVEDLVCRVRQGGQPAMDALASATSRVAEALGLGQELGVLAPGFRADIIATNGDPSREIEALRRVTFVMQGGRVIKLEQRGSVRAR
ncbi:MAG TPA: amidohydrolase family protein [Gemmatimonadaceae bacterium]|nr:amidohydrolase family protein [Gemmatimonadaceae bacterium]